MNNKNKGFIYREIGTAESKITFNTQPTEPEHTIKILDKSGKEVREHDYISPTDGKVIIVLKFRWDKGFEEVHPEEIVYDLPKSDDWDITNGDAKIKADKQPQFDKAAKEAHKKLLKEKKPNLFGFDKKEAHTGNIEYNITEEKGKWQINFYKKDATNASLKIFSENRIYIEPEYYETKKITYPKGGNATEEEAKKSQSTMGWTIFFVVLATIMLLIVVFWKKIRKWIKGESKQEKKVKEQLDIF